MSNEDMNQHADFVYFNGVKYLPIEGIAELSGLTKDDIVSLLRHGKIRGRQLGTKWYVDYEHLRDSVLRESEKKEEENRNKAQREETIPQGAAAEARTIVRVPPRFQVPAPQASFVLVRWVVGGGTALALGLGVYAISSGSTGLIYSRTGALTAASALSQTSDQSFLGFLAQKALGLFSSAPTNETDSTAKISGSPTSKTASTGYLPTRVSTSSQSIAAINASEHAEPSVPQTIVNQPVIERVIEKQTVVTQAGVSETTLADRLQEFQNKIMSQVYSLTGANSTVTAQNYNVIAQTNRIDQLSRTAINNPTITGGSISGASISGTISADSISSTNLTVTGSATSTFSAGIQLSSGCFRLADGTCAGSGGGTVGTGTQGQLPFYNSAGTTLSATSSIYLATSGNVGLGTTTPSARLEVVNTSSGATADQLYLTNLASATSTASRLTFRTQDLTNNIGTSTASITSILQQNYTGGKGDLAFSVLNAGALTEAARFSNEGYLGLGTSSPFRKLSVTDTVANAQVAIAYDASRAAEMRVDTSGDLNIAASGSDTFLNNDNFWVCTGGSITTNGCPSGTPTGQGNIIVENKVGVGTTTPAYKLSIETQDSTTNFLQIASTTNQALFVVNSTGNVGIGTTTPSAQLALSNLLYVGAGGTTGMGTATSTFYGDIKIIGKLDVGTIDPVYTIDGTKYATYGASTVGVKEETAFKITTSEWNPTRKLYEYRINFDALEKGSDLWLFYQVTDFGKYWENLVVSLTPAFDGKVFYEEDISRNTLHIYSDRSASISVRMLANRFDYMKWPNLRPDQGDKDYKGFEISSKTSLAQ